VQKTSLGAKSSPLPTYCLRHKLFERSKNEESNRVSKALPEHGRRCAGCTVNDAIKNTLGLDVNNRFRKRLQRWLGKVERGDNIAAAIRGSKLGSPLAWAFDDKVNQGNTLTILETLESFYRTNYSYCVNLARYIMWPCLILFMGVIVGFVVYAVFSPTIVIIERLSGMVIP